MEPYGTYISNKDGLKVVVVCISESTVEIHRPRKRFYAASWAKHQAWGAHGIAPANHGSCTCHGTVFCHSEWLVSISGTFWDMDSSKIWGCYAKKIQGPYITGVRYCLSRSLWQSCGVNAFNVVKANVDMLLYLIRHCFNYMWYMLRAEKARDSMRCVLQSKVDKYVLPFLQYIQKSSYV